ncbi:DUF3465 domain-containing protein [Zhongshania sp.]|uniref:DUF3465 domain-containing protein n=1 Tax=Zhongshania sp. TaxID=1971902 RepID=UPI003563ADDE
MKAIILVIIVVIIAVSYSCRANRPERMTDALSSSVARIAEADQILGEAYKNKRSDIQVQGQGRVEKILPDDSKGSRHQRFILRLSSGQTLLVAHNIDLAPRIAGLQVGDSVGFFGEYEWNQRGGVVHWTHRDPAGRHAHGWLAHQGRRYQ